MVAKQPGRPGSDGGAARSLTVSLPRSFISASGSQLLHGVGGLEAADCVQL